MGQPVLSFLQDLRLLCPHLESLSIDRSSFWRDKEEEDGGEEEELAVDHPEVFLSAGSFLSQFGTGSTLRSLTLDSDEVIVNCLPVLSYVSQLSSLCLNGLGEFRLEDLSSIHAYCPQLKLLSVGKKVTLSAPSDELGQALVESKYVCSTMKALELNYSHPWAEPVIWLNYFAKAYPNLARLHLRETRTNTLHRLNMTSFYVTDWDVHEAIRRLRLACPLLKTVEMIGVFWCHRILKPLFLDSEEGSTTAIRQLALNYNTYFTKDLYEGLSSYPWHALRSLTIYSCDENKPLSLPQIFSPLNALHLEELTLGGEGTDPDIRVPVYLDEVLHHCQHLKVLRVDNSRLLAAKAGKEPHPRLQSLTLYNVVFTDWLFDCIAKQCQNLRYLSLIECLDKKEMESQAFDIYLPYSQLEAVNLHQLVMHKQRLHAFPVYHNPSLFEISQDTHDQWVQVDTTGLLTKHSFPNRHIPPQSLMHYQPGGFHLLNEETTRILKGLRAKTIKRLLTRIKADTKYWEEKLEQGYVSITCKSINKLYINGRRISLPCRP
ncbi:hypothetical protein EC973_002495 [Apophysomyces ossiformis]|uniref:F-box/LRR-repeat protein 15/At3g58940/PEG3-like LRR domain-containing protein n=1 Tax=Apophysomyces ossiformis TaxID=679940 RepID=A0A8H7BY94_9FUNG|nr:hypothetical protein EC973_002495 [Apophysomyces ossiformis]